MANVATLRGVVAVGASAVLTTHGVLDSRTYRSLRDWIIEAALDEPTAVVVDVTDLRVPAESAWVVFTSTRWHVGCWPEVPIVVVCEHLPGRSAIARNGVSRYVPVYPSIRAAADALAHPALCHARRRARANMTSLRRARELVDEWVRAWSQPELIAVAKVIATVLVENVLVHTNSEPSLRLE